MTVSFIVRQLNVTEQITSDTGTIPLYGIINRVLIDTYDHDTLLKKGQGLVSTQRRVANYVKRIYNNVVVPNQFADADNNWSLEEYTIVNESDVDSITETVVDLINN